MSSNLFEPSGDGAIESASYWLLALLQGQAITAIAVLAIAFLGYQLLTGRFSMRDGLRIILGCFVLLGSAAIARGLIDVGRGDSMAAPIAAAAPSPAPTYPPPRAQSGGSGNPFDPYANGPPQSPR